MSLDNRYIPDISLSEFLIDPETGLPITGGTVEFWQDEDRSQPKNVFQLAGSPPNYTYEVLPNPMSIVSGIPVNENGDNVAIYYFPYDELGAIQNYYIVMKNEDGVVINEREAWPNLTASDDPTQTENSVTNELENGQFSQVLFEPEYGLTIVTDGAVSDQLYEIAPRWYLRVSTNAIATILIERTSLEGSLNIETNPPYQLEITPEGGAITALALIQRLNHNPDIWANGYVAASLVATSLDGISHTIEGIYSPNIAAAGTTIFSATTGATGYVRLSGTEAIPPGTNTDNADTGYVDFIINLPTIGAVAVTSIQVVGLESNQENVDYDQQTVNRQDSLLFSYYNPLIQQVPVPSILQGWDFKVNPKQFSSSVSLGAFSSEYVWDQLIVWQDTNSAISVAPNLNDDLVVTRGLTCQYALIQYLEGRQLKELLSSDFSVLIRAFTNLVAGDSGTVSFWVTSDAMLPNAASGTNLSLINTMSADGKPLTFHGNWTEIARNYRGDGRFTIPYGSDPQTISLEGWNRTTQAAAGTYTYAAIVVGFSSALSVSSTTFDSISVTPGLLARPVAPLSYNLTLAELQFFYEKSYGSGVLPGAVTNIDCLVRPQYLSEIDAPLIEIQTSAFDVEFKQPKRAIPNFHLYTPDGAIDNVRLVKNTTIELTSLSVSNWFETVGTLTAQYFPNNDTNYGNTAGARPSIQFHYVADARLGIVL